MGLDKRSGLVAVGDTSETGEVVEAVEIGLNVDEVVEVVLDNDEVRLPDVKCAGFGVDGGCSPWLLGPCGDVREL